jgi:CheY-like chemotaxis protein
MLQSADLRAASADDGLQAVEFIGRREAHPSVAVFADVQMPRMGGIELLEWINRHAPSTATVIIPGNQERELLSASLGGGAVEFLDQAFDLRAILHTTRQARETHSRHRRIHPPRPRRSHRPPARPHRRRHDHARYLLVSGRAPLVLAAPAPLARPRRPAPPRSAQPHPRAPRRCSSGQEPYSLAMLIDTLCIEGALPGVRPEQFEIIGTDVSTVTLGETVFFQRKPRPLPP